MYYHKVILFSVLLLAITDNVQSLPRKTCALVGSILDSEFDDDYCNDDRRFNEFYGIEEQADDELNYKWGNTALKGGNIIDSADLAPGYSDLPTNESNPGTLSDPRTSNKQIQASSFKRDAALHQYHETVPSVEQDRESLIRQLELLEQSIKDLEDKIQFTKMRIRDRWHSKVQSIIYHQKHNIPFTKEYMYDSTLLDEELQELKQELDYTRSKLKALSLHSLRS